MCNLGDTFHCVQLLCISMIHCYCLFCICYCFSATLAIIVWCCYLSLQYCSIWGLQSYSVCRYYFSLNVKLLFYLHWRWTIHIIFAFAKMHFYCSCSGNDSEEAVKLQYRWYCTICCFVMRKWAFSYCNRALSCFFFFFESQETLWRSKHFIP